MTVGIAGFYHLGLFGLFLPYLAFKSSRRLAVGPLPPKPKYFMSVIIILAMGFVVSAFIARREWIDVFPRVAPEPRMIVLGAAVLVALVVHALYDVVAGLYCGAYGEKTGYPIEPMPA